MKNIAVRMDAQKAGVKLWQIADELGLSDCNFSRKLRKELPDAEKEKIRQIIVRLKGVRR